MTMTTASVMAALAIFLAIGLSAHTLIRLSKLPDSRDHRPVAPAVALGSAYGLLKLQTMFGVPELMPGVRELAWQVWEICMLLELWFLIHMYTKCRKRCPPPQHIPIMRTED